MECNGMWIRLLASSDLNQSNIYSSSQVAAVMCSPLYVEVTFSPFYPFLCIPRLRYNQKKMKKTQTHTQIREPRMGRT
jgi:hypothetical protein